MLRKVILGSGFVALVPAVHAATPTSEGHSGPAKPPPMRATDLPIYEAPHAEYFEQLQNQSKNDKPSYIRSILLPPVRAVREKLEVAIDHTAALKHTVEDNYNEFKDRSDWIVKYLREEENKDIRYGAVVMGGLTGFIFGLRGGFFRKLIYTSVGTATMGAICFPEESKEFYNENGAVAKKYVNIAYNFLYGIKPGDTQLELKLPELSFPKTFSEFVDVSVSVGSSIKQVVMPPSKEVPETKPSDKAQ